MIAECQERKCLEKNFDDTRRIAHFKTFKLSETILSPCLNRCLNGRPIKYECSLRNLTAIFLTAPRSKHMQSL